MMEPAHAASREPVTDPVRALIDELLMLERTLGRHYEGVYDAIRPCPGRSILEVGSGIGVMSRFLVARGDPVILSDHHPADLHRLRSRSGDRAHVSVQLLDLDHPPYPIERRVDSIICLNVLEHVADDRSALGGLAALLAPAGRLVLQVPNYPALFGSLDEAYGHLRRYTRPQVADRLAAAGLRVVMLRAFDILSRLGGLALIACAERPA